MQPDPNAGYDSGRLHKALSEAYAAEHNWVSEGRREVEREGTGGTGGGGGTKL